MAAYTAAKAGLSALTETLMLELAGSGVVAVDVRPGDHRTEFGRNLGVPGREPMPEEVALLKRYRAAMEGGPPPERVARALVRMLAAGRSGTVRCGSLFQARIAPMLAWAGPAAWRRAGIRRYHGLSKASFS